MVTAHEFVYGMKAYWFLIMCTNFYEDSDINEYSLEILNQEWNGEMERKSAILHYWSFPLINMKFNMASTNFACLSVW